MRSLRNYIQILTFFILLLVACKKVVEQSPEKAPVAEHEAFVGKGGIVLSHTNEHLLSLVLSGSGGIIMVDTISVGAVDSLTQIAFPSFAPPVNNAGMLEFLAVQDYDNFIKAANLMEDLWIYSEIDYEDTPDEIYHLGEESFNALDSATGFTSLRGIYELNDFYNSSWRDTAMVYVEDDDIQIVMNQQNEVKIGDKYYKYITDNVLSKISNLTMLDSVRAFGVFTNGRNVVHFDEETGLEVPEPEDGPVAEGCGDFYLSVSGIIGSYPRWGLNVMVMNPVTGNQPSLYSNVKANYTVDWGDGSVENFVGYFGLVNHFNHDYQYPSSGFVNRTISVTCQIISQSPPSTGYSNLINNCAGLPGIVFTGTTTIKLESYNYPECMSGRIIREFNGNEVNVQGTWYRLACKIKQVSTFAGFIIEWRRPKIVTTAIFQKFKNGRWKKTKSLGDIKLTVRGEVYRDFSCTDIFHTINFPSTKKKKKKIKVKFLGIPGTSFFYPPNIRTHRNLPTAINVDFVWKYNNNQVTVGNYNEVLKP